MTLTLAKRLISATEYHKMAEVGILKSDDKVELINGEIIQMSPIGSKHAAYIDLLNELFIELLGRKVQIRVQSSIRLDEYSEPEPDIILLKRRKDFYLNRIPRAKDAYLVIEVADSTLEKDRAIKAPLYAIGEISDYWILNIEDKQLEVFSKPVNGIYKEQTTLKGKQEVYLSAFDLSIKIEDIFVLADLE